MAKGKGSSASGPRGRKKAAKEGRDAKTSESGGVEDECDQLRREFYSLEEKRAKLLKKEHKLEVRRPKLEAQRRKLEAQRRKLEEQKHKLADKKRKLEEEKRKLEEPLPPLRSEVEQMEQNWIPKSSILKELCCAREVENAQRLDKLPHEVWDKILGHLEENDLFPLALSCRYFRQKQKELVARTRQNGRESGKPRLALKTTLHYWPREGKPASADYLRFCSEEKVSKDHILRAHPEDLVHEKASLIQGLAAFHGHLPLLQELQAGSVLLDSNIIWAAALGCQLATLQWLKTQKGFKGFELDAKVSAPACRGGHLEMLKWLRSEGCTWDVNSCSRAAEGGHLEVLKWLRSEGCTWNESACSGAAYGGHLEVLKWLRSEGCPWNEEACEWAAWGGHLEVLKWLRSKGCPWDERACRGAARGGQLEILKWLRSEGCPWDERACLGAADNDHLEMLKWLRSEGCPWNERTCRAATLRGHQDVLQWAIDNGCPFNVTDFIRNLSNSRFPSRQVKDRALATLRSLGLA